MTQAAIIVKSRTDGRIVRIVEGVSVDDVTVERVVAELRSLLGDRVFLDLSQIEAARAANESRYAC